MANSDGSMDSLLDVFLYESSQLNDQLVDIILHSEESKSLSSEEVNEIFRIMHTIKGSSALMNYSQLSTVAHRVEDLFYYIREKKPQIEYDSLCDIVLSASDYIKEQLETISEGNTPNADNSAVLAKISDYLQALKLSNGEGAPQSGTAGAGQGNKPKAAKGQKLKIMFEPGWQMENIRAYTVLDTVTASCEVLSYYPENLLTDSSTAEIIAQQGFSVEVISDENLDALLENIRKINYVQSAEIEEQPKAAKDETPKQEAASKEQTQEKKEQDAKSGNVKSSLISVNTNRLDNLLNLVGEIVISQAMVLRNPDLQGLQLDNFQKAAAQLDKLTGELQDAVMALRLIPIAGVFNKMTRVVRDMNKNLGKNVVLEIIGQETEVDKNIIDHLSDPIMHLVRNAVDHGIEDAQTRRKNNKPEQGHVTLSAANTGSQVIVTIKDDGKGINKQSLLQKAKQNGILTKSEDEMTDREILALALHPGISTKKEVTEYSGRGVGLDVVKKNIEEIGGSVLLESIEGEGTTITLKIPLTLAIVDGMITAVGDAVFAIPISSVRETLRPAAQDLYVYPPDNEMVMLRGENIPIIRLSKIYDIPQNITELTQGTLIVVENDGHPAALFVDEILGDQQVVVKSIPEYLNQFHIDTKCGIGGCTILGDGKISLILDISKLIRRIYK